MSNKDVVFSYFHPRVFRLKGDESKIESNYVIEIYGMNRKLNLLLIPKAVHAEGVHKKNSDTIAELLLATRYHNKGEWKQNPHTNGYGEETLSDR